MWLILFFIFMYFIFISFFGEQMCFISQKQQLQSNVRNGIGTKGLYSIEADMDRLQQLCKYRKKQMQ